CRTRCSRLIPRSAAAECTLLAPHEAPRPAACPGSRRARVRPGRAGVLPHLPCGGLPDLGGEPAREGGAEPSRRGSAEAALPAMPLPRRAARRASGRGRRLLRDLPRRRALLPARGGDARQGAGAALRTRRSHRAVLHGLPWRAVAFAASVRREGGDAAHRSLDRGPRRAQAEARDLARGQEVSSVAEELVPAGPPATAVSEVAQLPPPTEEESHAVVEKIWRFFCSLRLTLVNLLLLFLSMIAGTFVNPQNDSLANIERAFAGREWTLRAYRWLELYDLFHSW